MADNTELSYGLKPGMGTYFVVRKDGGALIRSVVKPHMTNNWAFAVYGNRALLERGRRAKAGVHHKVDANTPLNLAPRTALGLSADKKTLVIVAIDGRQKGYSEGATFAEVADILLREGCSDAVNMDGGGSTSLVIWDRVTGNPIMLNRHGGGARRRVALNMGITFDD